MECFSNIYLLKIIIPTVFNVAQLFVSYNLYDTAHMAYIFI